MEYFTDDDIQFLGANFSEEHAKAARWFGEGMPGLGKGEPTDDPEADTQRAMAAVNAAGARATGLSPDSYEHTIVDALFIIGVRRKAAERHDPQFLDDTMRWRNASGAEKQRIQEEITAKYSS